MQKRAVTIIGAGPAGTTAALFLHKAGIPFYLLDKAVFPRIKACADTVTSKPLRMLHDLGIKPFEWGKGEAMYGVKVLSHKGQTASIKYKSLYSGTDIPSCLSIPRAEFDLKLVEEVQQRAPGSFFEGVKIKSIDRTKDEVEVRDEAGILYRSDLLILATGSNCRWPSTLGIQKPDTSDKFYGVGLRAYYSGVQWPKEQESWFGISRDLMPGAIYASPVGNGLVNLNVVVRADNPQMDSKSIKALFEDSMKNLPGFKESFNKAELVGEPAGSKLKYGTRKRPLSGDRVLLIGDAAGLVDLASANGIANAMVSARIAAEFIIEAFDSGHLNKSKLSGYDTAIWKAVENELKFGRMISGMLDYSWTREVLLWGSNWVTGMGQKSGFLSSVVYHPKPGALIKSLIGSSLKA